jgi:sugar lactone lactonase YvrE
VNVEVIRKDPAINEIVGPNPKIFKLAEGFQFTEGPIWVHDGGYLLFSDPNANTQYKYTKDGELTVFRHPSGYSGADIAEYGQPGSNGLTLDQQGRLTINEHGNRRVTRLEKDGSLSVLADRYEGKRLNSPNDLVYRSDGALYFTDPPFGLPKFFDDPRKELPFSGVFSLQDGKLQLVTTDLTGPNGIAFSPDEKYLYVTNWDEKKKVVMRYESHADGTVSNGKVFFDMTSAPGEDALDGMKVDQRGNLYVSVQAGCGSFRPTESIWVRSSPRSTRTTWLGGMTTERPCTSALEAASTRCDSTFQAFAREGEPADLLLDRRGAVTRPALRLRVPCSYDPKCVRARQYLHQIRERNWHNEWSGDIRPSWTRQIARARAATVISSGPARA